MTKKKVPRRKTLDNRAHQYACARRKDNVPAEWNMDMAGSYWWGLYEGYQAGVRAERRRK